VIARYRWFRVETSGVSAICVEFATGRLPRTDDGRFVHAQLPDGTPGFRYVWGSTIVVSRLGTRGNIESEVIPTISSIQFSLRSIGDQATLLRISEPGRNIRPLLAALESVSGFGFSCTPIVLSDLPNLSILDEVDAAHLTGLKMTNVGVAPGVTGRMEFASLLGIRDGDLAQVMAYAHRQEEVAYNLVHRGLRGQLSFASRGLVRIGGALAPRILSFVERDILALHAPR